MKTFVIGLLFILLLTPLSNAEIMRQTEMAEVKGTWISVVCRLDKGKSYCSLVITRPADSPPIPIKETSLVVFDLAGKARKLTPIDQDREILPEAGTSLSSSANLIFLLDGRDFKNLSVAEVTYFGQQHRLKFR